MTVSLFPHHSPALPVANGVCTLFPPLDEGIVEKEKITLASRDSVVQVAVASLGT